LAATAPSSWNLQHWKFIVVQDQQIKEHLLPIAYGQQQVIEASAVIISSGACHHPIFVEFCRIRESKLNIFDSHRWG
jgi:nitroreductase